MNKIILLIPVLLLALNSNAQDNVQTFSLGSFLQAVKKFHPIAKQADIQVDKAGAAVLTARGGFDPVFESDGNNKTFNGVNYYRNNSMQVNIPTWYGIEIKTGIEYLAGNRTNPEETAGKTSFAGISFPIAKNLLMDKRRAVLQQAKIMVNASEQEKRIMLNDLLKEASDSYWQWTLAYFNFQTFTRVLENNKKRIDMVRTAFTIGEKAAIDTTEAMVQLQSFTYQQNEARVALQNATLLLNNFLWKENNEAYDIPYNIIAPNEKLESLSNSVIFPELEQLLQSVIKSHPELVNFEYKLDMLLIEKKLRFQDLLPKIDLKYNQLGSGYNIASTTVKPLFENNYRYGIGFSIPLRLSEGRGAYKAAKLRIEETELEAIQKSNTISNKVKAVYYQLENYKSQVNLLEKTYFNYLLLQRAEETRFFNGESSLFLINARENKTLETQLKLNETTINYNKTANILRWSAGELWGL